MNYFLAVSLALLVVNISTVIHAHVPAVRDADPGGHPPAVRDANPSSQDDGGAGAAVSQPAVSDSANGNNAAPDSGETTAPPPPAESNGDPNNNGNGDGQNPNSLSGIRNEFVGGVKAIGSSGIQLVGLGVNTVEQGVANVFRPVVTAVDDIGQGVVNGARAVKEGVVNAARPVINAAHNVGSAGSQIAGAWGNSLQQTKNITGQLFENIGK